MSPKESLIARKEGSAERDRDLSSSDPISHFRGLAMKQVNTCNEEKFGSYIATVSQIRRFLPSLGLREERVGGELVLRAFRHIVIEALVAGFNGGRECLWVLTSDELCRYYEDPVGFQALGELSGVRTAENGDISLEFEPPLLLGDFPNGARITGLPLSDSRRVASLLSMITEENLWGKPDTIISGYQRIRNDSSKTP